MKLLLLGANGQVGFELHRSLAPLGEIVAATRTGALPGASACERADLAETGALATLIDRVAPDWIVNASAYTAVDRAEDERELARRVNGDALRVIGERARARGAAVLHYSTDYVFGGNGTRPYREDDATAPLNAYGASKLAGEVALRESGARHLVFRTAWVYASRGQNFLRTMLKLAATRDRLTVVADQRGAPTPARLLAEVAAHAIARFGPETPADRWGIYHVAASGETSWCEFARTIVERAAAAGLIGRAPEVAAIASTDYPTRARRPAYSVLDTGKIERALGLAMPPWERGVEACIAEVVESTRATTQ